jgi:putative ABC transport system permease protein
MGSLLRGIRNAFRNLIRTVSIVIILGLSIGLSLAMLVAHQAVGQKISSVKAGVGSTITISPAGVRGFEGGGSPLTQSQIDKVKGLPHITSVSESLNDRLTSNDTNLQSSIDLGQLGQRFIMRGFNGGAFSRLNTSNFTPPVTVIGATNPTNLANTQGGGTFTLKSGQVFSATSTENIALLGSALAAKNKLSVGSAFTAYGTTIKVAGIFDAGNTFSNSQLIMPLATLQKLSAQPNDLTSAVAVVDSIDNVSSAATAITNTLGSAADVTSDQARTQQTIAPLQSIQNISLYSLIGAVIAGTVIILLTMVMIVRERRREIGVLRAIGASKFRVMVQFMAEAATFTGLGAVLGIALGVMAANPITQLLVNNSANTAVTGASGPEMMGFRSGIGRGFGFVRNNITDIHAAVGWSIIAYGLAAAVVIALLGSALSAYFIAKVRPAEVMRSE